MSLLCLKDSQKDRLDSNKFDGIDSFDFLNEVEVGIGGDDLFYAMINHGGGMDRITRGDSVDPF